MLRMMYFLIILKEIITKFKTNYYRFIYVYNYQFVTNTFNLMIEVMMKNKIICIIGLMWVTNVTIFPSNRVSV